MVTFDDKDNRFGAYAKSLSDQAAYKKAAPERAWNEMKNYHNQNILKMKHNILIIKVAHKIIKKQ